MTDNNSKPTDLPQDDEQKLVKSIGTAIRKIRKKADLSVKELAEISAVSAPMLSRLENGLTAASLNTIEAISKALDVPITNFFKDYDRDKEAVYVAAGTGSIVERRGTKSGHQYEVLGYSIIPELAFDPCLITLTDKSEVFPFFEHEGTEYIYMLEGKMSYRVASKVYDLSKGDSLYFDATAPHGTEELLEMPIRLLCIVATPRN